MGHASGKQDYMSTCSFFFSHIEHNFIRNQNSREGWHKIILPQEHFCNTTSNRLTETLANLSKDASLHSFCVSFVVAVVCVRRSKLHS
mmetsp:Transcript_71897/g.144689  ORF Transcript_71897/g.144689 Transcript_71897/m.144689 type:complete len:88 (-) Transcript_71897:569-832(-)